MSFSPSTRSQRGGPHWLSIVLWGAAIGMIALLGLVLVRRFINPSAVSAASSDVPQTIELPKAAANVSLPAFAPLNLASWKRPASVHTIIPNRGSEEIINHRVVSGDSIFAIAKEYNLKPESVLWANYDVLNDNPDLISIDQELTIPPTDGVVYEWKEGDKLDHIAGLFKSSVDEILSWPGNRLDMANPVIEPGQEIMIPGGEREFVRTWVMGYIPRGAAGVTTGMVGGCVTGEGGAYGTGTFIWPSYNTWVSGNDFWSGHLAIDIAAGQGVPIYASDSGVVVFAGWNTSGYGNTVMIDHGNGFQTLYAHMSSLSVRCGQSVYQGNTIGLAGSTGNSTGPHLHFEVRYFGTFVNPWTVLP